MKYLRFMFIMCVYLTGCIEHRPEDTLFVPQPKKEVKTTTEKPPKGLKVYTGTIPCADCPGIEQRLALKGDSSGVYRLTETYKEATEDGDEVLVSTGEWKKIRTSAAEGKKPVFYLSQGEIRDSSRIIRYLVYNDKIVQMDIEGKEITNQTLYTLKLITRNN